MLSAGGALAAAGCGRGETVPDLPYTLLDGTRGTLGAARGRVLLVNFWATTCAVCVHEMPALVALHEALAPRGLATLAVAMSWDPPALVSRFAEQRRLPFGVVIDLGGALARGLGDVQVTPTTLVVDPQGAVAWRGAGAPDFARLHALVDRLLPRT